VGDVIARVGLVFLDDVFRPWAATERGNFYYLKKTRRKFASVELLIGFLAFAVRKS